MPGKVDEAVRGTEGHGLTEPGTAVHFLGFLIRHDWKSLARWEALGDKTHNTKTEAAVSAHGTDDEAARGMEVHGPKVPGTAAYFFGFLIRHDGKSLVARWEVLGDKTHTTRKPK